MDRRYPVDNNCRASTRDFNWAWAGLRGGEIAHSTVWKYLRTRVGQVGADGPQQVEVPLEVTKKWAPSARCGIVIALALVMILLGFGLISYWPKVIIL